MKIFCAYKGNYPNGMAMANRLDLYAKALSNEGVSFLVAAEGPAVASDKGPQHLFGQHSYWHWRTSSRWTKLPFVGAWFAQWDRRKLRKHIATTNDYAAVFVAGYRWFDLYLLHRACKKSGKRMFIELNELPHSILAGRMDSEWQNRVRRYITLNWIFPKLDGFLTISEALANLARKQNPTAKICTVPILSEWIEADSAAATEPKNVPFIFHAGTLTVEKDGILAVVEAFGKFHQKHHSPLRFEFSNRKTLPSILKQMDELIARYGVADKVVFHNHLSKEVLDEKFKQCTLVVINKPTTLRNSYNFSTKLGECMSYHLPIITTAVGESARYLQHEKNALVINDAEDAEEIADHIAALIESPELRKRLGEQAAHTAKTHFNYTAHQKALASFFAPE